MKFLTSDTIFVGTCSLLIASLSALLYADFNRKIDAGNLKQIGTITFKRQMAQRKYLAQVVWEDIEQNFPVFNDDSIRTSAESEAVIHLNDGTDISIDENSMIMLSTNENQININFEHGAISANRSGVAGVDIAAINIKSQDTTVSIDRSNIQLTQMDNQSLDLTVSDGTAKVSSGKDETTVNANEKAIIESNKETKVVKLNFILKEPAPNKYYMLETGASDIVFSWETEGNVQDYTLQISRDRKFKNIIISRKTGSVKQSVEKLDSGTWFWRIAAFNTDTQQTEYSEIRKINIQSRKSARLIAPSQGELISQTASENSVAFRWNDEEKSNDYVLEISSGSDFGVIVNTQSTNLRSIIVEDLPQGEYFWRVKSNITIGTEKFIKISGISSFRIEKGRTLKPPLLVTPSAGEKIDITAVRERGLIFSWNNEPGYINYKIEISRDENFTDVVTSQDNKANFYRFKNENLSGRFYWRVSGILNKAGERNTSLTGNFELTVKENIQLAAPVEGAEIKLESEGKKTDVKFSWSPSGYSGKYRVQVSTNREFTDAKTIDRVSNNSSVYAMGDPGEYFWRVLLYDDKGKEIVKSSTGKFIILAADKKIGKSFVHVKSPVSGSRIYIDSKYKGLGEVRQDVKPGEKVKVRVITKDFEDYSTTVTVKEGETVDVSPKLDRKKKLERIKWASAFGSPIVSTPVYAKDRIITCSENGTVTVLSKNGTVIFSKKVAKKFDSKPVVYGDNAYVVDVEGILYSLDIVNGKLNWKSDTGGPMLFKAGPVVVKERIYVASGYGMVTAFDLKGKKLWENNLDEAIYNSILVLKKNLIIATDALNVYALDVDDGDENWSTEIEDRVITLTPLSYNDFIYFGCYSGRFYALKENNGKVAWTFMAGGPIYSSAAVHEKNILFGSDDGYLYSLTSDKGTLNWKFKAGGPIHSSPLIAFGSIFITDDRTLFALNPTNGIVIWQNTFESKIKTSPTVVDDTLILGLSNGKVVSVRNNLIETVEK